MQCKKEGTAVVGAMATISDEAIHPNACPSVDAMRTADLFGVSLRLGRLPVVVFQDATAFAIKVFKLPGRGGPPEGRTNDDGQHQRQRHKNEKCLHLRRPGAQPE